MLILSFVLMKVFACEGSFLFVIAYKYFKITEIPSAILIRQAHSTIYMAKQVVII